ncbi:polysaccharide deacetylase family protein [Streptomyces sp. I05A-00742]|uniref:polysaccharide deacetylase family protein n=1 Tax=Streptomyces sp. I05A-00742 TaxID=2732853 RepID=UPI0028969961|nr:polysaccharide deacetylase family protein [Streptomyces sp. I05A-00742]
MAALLGGFTLSEGAGAAGTPADRHRPPHALQGTGPAALSKAGTQDLKAWKAARLANDRLRRSGKLVVSRPTRTTPTVPSGTTPPKTAAVPAVAPLTSGVSGTSGPTVVTAAAKLPAAVPGGASALVLYDSAGPYGYLGELYAMAVANLAGHFGTVTAKPVSAYTAGMVNQYTATLYVGSTYYGGPVPDAVPAAFYQDALATTRPVTWVGDNIWGMANAVGVSTFKQRYGWDPTASFYESGGTVGNITQVTYKGRQLTRKIPAGFDGGVLHPALATGPGYPQVTQLAQARDANSGNASPWAIRSGNLTYVGEIPFTYVSESDRVIAFEDLLFDGLAPGTAERHRAFVRLEDISPKSDPNDLRKAADYLFSQKIPYGINVIPVYTDPKGTYNSGRPETVTLAQSPGVVSALKYMLARGAVLMDHGYTHQYSNVNNPYSGVTGDDFEFFRAHVDASDNVVYDGPTAQDSTAWAQTRVTSALAAFAAAGLPRPALWTTPHYAASATDYRVLGQNFSARLERSLYFTGTLTGAPTNSGRYIGQFFPYAVKDVYGTTVLPENLGNYEPEPYNNHPARLPADLIASARANLAVRDGVASFFYHPYFGTAPLQQTVEGIRALGYTFVGPTDLNQ